MSQSDAPLIASSESQVNEEADAGPKSTSHNAFSELMKASKKRKLGSEHEQEVEAKAKAKAKAKAQPKRPHGAHSGGSLNARDGKDALANYTAEPERFGAEVVLYHTERFVAVNDAFPKGAVHALLLPRDPAVAARHPLDALQDPEILAGIRAELPRLKRLAASELRRKFARSSRQDAARLRAMDADIPPPLPEEDKEGEKKKKEEDGGDGDGDDGLPPGRDWEAELEVGVHAGPSMNHLHVHVLSREYMGAKGRTGRHYQTFKTPFFVRLDEFPLHEGDGRFGSLKDYLARDLLCWRCGRNFKRGWTALERHLQEEFEEWKAE